MHLYLYKILYFNSSTHTNEEVCGFTFGRGYGEAADHIEAAYEENLEEILYLHQIYNVVDFPLFDISKEIMEAILEYDSEL